jgi:hypothetical protein
VHVPLAPNVLFHPGPAPSVVRCDAERGIAERFLKRSPGKRNSIDKTTDAPSPLRVILVLGTKCTAVIKSDPLFRFFFFFFFFVFVFVLPPVELTVVPFARFDREESQSGNTLPRLDVSFFIFPAALPPSIPFPRVLPRLRSPFFSRSFPTALIIDRFRGLSHFFPIHLLDNPQSVRAQFFSARLTAQPARDNRPSALVRRLLSHAVGIR